MNLEPSWIAFSVQGEPVRGYLARPAAAPGPLPGVIVIQEIWGVDAHVQDVVRRFAAAGYAALAPDLYSRGRTPPELAPDRIEAAKALLDTIPPAGWWDPAARAAAVGARPAAEREPLAATLAALLPAQRPTERWLETLGGAAAHLREGPSRGRRIGAVGFCVGGALAAQLAAREPSLAGAAVFYGASPPAEVAARIRCPILGLYGEDDPRIVAGLPAFAEALARAGQRFEHHVYPRTPHAFFNDTRRSYRAEAARDAWARVLSFLAGALAAPAG